MSWLNRLRRRRYDDEEFQAEIRAHLAIAAEERIADGADPKTARQAALKEFGNVTLTREAAHRVWTPRWLDALRDVLSDVRYAIRGLLKNPAFSLTVVGVLTVGIGLNAAVFTMLKSLALSPIAGVDKSARLHVIYGETGTGRDVGVSYPDYQYLRDHDAAFSGLFGTNVGTVTLGRGRSARPVWTELVTGNYFQRLDVRAALGRTLLPSDEIAAGQHPVVVLGHGLWRTDFRADPEIVGKTIEVNSIVLTVVGVADAAFHGTTVSYDVELFIPVMTAPDLGFKFGSVQTTPAEILADRRAGVLGVMGRLRPGTSPAGAAAQTDAIWAALAPNHRPTDVVKRLRVVPFLQSPGTAPALLLPLLTVLSAMGLLVLMIACANIAGLVLVRGASRRGEIAVRLALGASRIRIIRLLIVENLVLAVPGAGLGLLLAWRGIPVLVGYAERLAAPQRVFFNLETDGLVIGFAALVACLSALVFGFVPALRSSRVDLVSVINQDASPRGAARGRLRSGLVVAQVTVSLLLLVGAGLVTRSLAAAERADAGFDADHVTAIAIDLKANGYDEARGRAFYRQLLDAARAEPGVESATLAASTPLTFLDGGLRPVAIEGREVRQDDDLSFLSNIVGPDYFRTLRIPLIAGREFEDRDDESSASVAIVNSTLAGRFWGGAANAVGRRVRVAEGDWRTVVGVAADVKYSRINEAPRPYVYLPFLQWYRSSMTLHTRGPVASPGAGPSTAVGIDQLVDEARASVAALDANLPPVKARSLAAATRGALVFFRLMASMLFVFGVAGMALAAMGTYGLVSYTVKQSTHEIGLRMALGASGSMVVRGFLVRGLRLGAIGAALGLVAALGFGRLLGSVLFGVSPTDGLSFAIALAIVLGGVMLATLVPAWRAARTNPLTALRHH
jgi:putative ABC transport system permease protein